MAASKAGGKVGNRGAKAKGRGPGKKDAAESERIQKLVDEAIEGIEKRLSDEKAPPTIGDYLKVMQLQKEIEEESPKEIKVTWVDPASATESEK